MKKHTVRRVPKAKILGSHPTTSHALGRFLNASDGKTNNGVPHRALSEANDGRKAAIEYLREVLVDHHASPQAIKRTELLREAMKRIGFGAAQKRLRRFPANLTTQKGNLAEIILAEYVVAANGLSLPVYRLRYNPNVEQSMKGDDVLAFDLDSNPVRIVVGEAKFRGTPTKEAVTDIVAGLFRSNKGGVPGSLQFVADRLFEEGQAEIGERVLECAVLFANEQLQLDYVGFLMSNTNSAAQIDKSTPATRTRLAMLSLGLADPDDLVTACFDGLE